MKTYTITEEQLIGLIKALGSTNELERMIAQTFLSDLMENPRGN